MIHTNVCFLILLICCWVVAASLMAEKTNVGVAVFVAGNTCVWFWVGWSCCPPFCVFAERRFYLACADDLSHSKPGCKSC